MNGALGAKQARLGAGSLQPRRFSKAHRAATGRASAAESQQVEKATTSYTQLGPDPTRFAVANGQLLNVASAAFPGLMRLGCGGFNYGYSSKLQKDDGTYAVVKTMGYAVKEVSDVGAFARPEKPLVLYEFEGCPFCKKVREAVSVLDLDVEVRPCPRDGPTYRPYVAEKGGKAQFPYLEDPNTNESMYESDVIIKYLFNKYGPGEEGIPRLLRLGFLTVVTCGIGLLPRAGKGGKYVQAKKPEKPLIFWGYELSPFVKVVREKLCEMEVPYLQRTCARGSPSRQELLDTVGHFQVPYLQDPNTGYALFESAAILRYLDQTYGQEAMED